MCRNVIFRQRRRIATLLAALALAAPDVATAADPTPMPIFDAHLHYLSLIHISEPTRPY